MIAKQTVDRIWLRELLADAVARGHHPALRPGMGHHQHHPRAQRLYGHRRLHGTAGACRRGVGVPDRAGDRLPADSPAARKRAARRHVHDDPHVHGPQRLSGELLLPARRSGLAAFRLRHHRTCGSPRVFPRRAHRPPGSRPRLQPAGIRRTASHGSATAIESRLRFAHPQVSGYSAGRGAATGSRSSREHSIRSGRAKTGSVHTDDRQNGSRRLRQYGLRDACRLAEVRPARRRGGLRRRAQSRSPRACREPRRRRRRGGGRHSGRTARRA